MNLSAPRLLISFDSWKNNLTFTLQLDERFAPFLSDSAKWQKAARNLYMPIAIRWGPQRK